MVVVFGRHVQIYLLTYLLTYRQTDTSQQLIPCLCIASCGNDLGVHFFIISHRAAASLPTVHVLCIITSSVLVLRDTGDCFDNIG